MAVVARRVALGVQLGRQRQVVGDLDDDNDGCEDSIDNCPLVAATNGDASVNLSDAISMLGYLFLRGPPPALGVKCTPIDGCPDVCGPR